MRYHSKMNIATYTHAENAQFLDELAGSLECGGKLDSAQRLRELAAREAEHDPAYVAFVNAKVRSSLNRKGPLYTEAEIDAHIASW